MKEVEEVWAELVNFPGYAVSNHGRVINLRTNVMLRPRRNSYGYTRVALRKDGTTHDVYIHHLVASTFITNYHRRVGVKHAGDNGDNHINNLRFQKGRRLGTVVRNPPKARARRIEVVETGMRFLTVESCANYIGGDVSSIYRVLRGERESHKGLTFRYQYEEQ